MLSRIAESFFWLGRYVERAEATARLLAEHHAANPATALDVAAAIGRSEAEPTTAQLRHADYRCDACDATGAQALEPGGPLHGTAVR